jgi:uncharacterized protein YhjY with autotransporter beta-barrel domain
MHQGISMASIRTFLCALLLLAPALSSAQSGIRLRADALDPKAVQASVDTPTRLQVVVEAGETPLAGREVHWKVKGDDAVLSKDKGLSSAGGGDLPPVGTASTLFTAHRGGSYTVTASTLADAACTGDKCAWTTMEFHVDVPGGAAKAEHDGPTVTQAAIAGAAVVALYAASREEGLPAVPTLALVSGNNQSVINGNAAPQPLVVRAADDGDPKSGVPITWTATGGATLSASSTTTDSSGETQITVTNVGPGPGTITITAQRADGAEAHVVFTITVLTPLLVKVSGDGQSAPINTTVPQPLVVEARVNSTPQSGIGINWQVISGDATIGSTSGATNGSGQSSATIDLGPTPGSVTVRATRVDQPTVSATFTINSLLIRTLGVVSGDNQTAAPNAALGAPLVVNAQDNSANASGVTINWTATGGATLSSPTSVTDGAGNASITVTSTGPGPDPFTVTATRADDPSATVTFNENILPPNLSIAGGDAQSGLTGSAAATALDVLLVDGASVPVSGQTITWTVTSGSAVLTSGSSVTDGAGHATMTFSFGGSPGPITIEASAYSGSQTVVFNETAVTASGINKTGDNQAANPGQVLAPFVVTIVPPAGVTDLSGVPVTFTVTSGTATLSVTSTTTDAAGQASTTATLGLTPGTVTVLAQVVNGPSTTFTATINGSLVGTILQIVSGDGQTLDVGVPSGNMVVELRDSGVLPGQTLSWSTNNGTVTPTSTVTDVNGRASATVTPATAGPVIVTVNFAAVAQYTSSSIAFQHNTTLGSIPSLTTDQAAVAVALDNACADLDSGGASTPEQQDLLDQCEALAGASAPAVAEAIDEMLPDVAQTQTQTGQQATDAQFSNINVRMSNLRAGVSGPSFNGITLTTPTGTISLGALANTLMQNEDASKSSSSDAGFSKWGFFASGNIGRGSSDAFANSPGYDFDIKGLTAGVDYRMSDTLVLGGALGYTRQSSDLDGNQGSLKMDGWSVSGYASWYHSKDWYIDGVLSLANNDYSHKRRVVYVLPGETVDQVARASSDGNEISSALTIGRDFHRQEWNFGVYGRAQWAHQNFDGYDEDLDASLSGSGLALHIEDRDVKSLSSIIGGKATWVHSTDWGVVMPQFGLEWQKEYQGDPDTFRAFLISDPTGTPILITGEALDDSYFRLNLGVSAVWTKGRSGFITYDRIFSRDGQEQETLTLGGRIEF